MAEYFCKHTYPSSPVSLSWPNASWWGLHENWRADDFIHTWCWPRRSSRDGRQVTWVFDSALNYGNFTVNSKTRVVVNHLHETMQVDNMFGSRLPFCCHANATTRYSAAMAKQVSCGMCIYRTSRQNSSWTFVSWLYLPGLTALFYTRYRRLLEYLHHGGAKEGWNESYFLGLCVGHDSHHYKHIYRLATFDGEGVMVMIHLRPIQPWGALHHLFSTCFTVRVLTFLKVSSQAVNSLRR